MKVGVNAHPPKCPASVVLDLGAQRVRFPPWEQTDSGEYQWLDCNDWIAEVIAGGCEPLLVLDDVCHGFKEPHQTWPAFYKAVRARYPQVGRWQILNEVDGLPGTASGPHPPRVLTARLRAARQGFGPEMIIYASALIGPEGPDGVVEYLNKVDLTPVDYVCAHIYGWPISAEWPIPEPDWTPIDVSLERAYLPFGKPVAITEIGGETDLFESEHQRAEYCSRAVVMLASLGVEEVDFYCLTAGQCGDLALIDENWEPKESFAAVKDAIKVCA